MKVRKRVYGSYFRLFVLSGLLTAGSLPAVFAESVELDNVEAELVSEVQSIRPGMPFWAAVRLKMHPSWHTYWKNPGDSGLATSVEWTLPEGFRAGPLVWPYPEKILTASLVTYAYEHEVFLLTEIQPSPEIAAGTLADLHVTAAWLACRIECVPGKAELELSLPVKHENPAADRRWSDGFQKTREKIPVHIPDWTVEAESFPAQRKVILGLTPPAWIAHDPGEVYFFSETMNFIDYAAPQHWKKTKEGFQLTLSFSKAATESPGRLSGVLVSKNGWRNKGSERALEMDRLLTVQADSAFPGEPAVQPMSFFTAVIFSFVGGLILNLMPCVLPVLSLKIFGFLKQRGTSRAKLALHGGVFTLGVLSSFWILAGFIYAFRYAGIQAGWGFQLQSPVMVAILGGLFFVLALNLFGVYEIGMAFTRIENPAKAGHPWVEDFLSGVLTTIVATPCTAPFMGAALGYAVSQPPLTGMLVFTFLGLGTAFPYLWISLFPGCVSFLPKPGAWMIRLKKILGILLLVTSVWLGWILSIQKGLPAVAALIAGSAVAYSALRKIGLAQNAGAAHFGRHQTKSLISSEALLVLALVIVLSGIRFSVDIEESLTGGIAQKSGWQAYDETTLQSLIVAGEPVFIDFTAAWCLTCQVNKKVALRSRPVRERFQELGVVLMKADWTNRDDRITEALARYGRSSIPLYIYYPRGKGESPVILPEVLTPGIVLDALDDNS